MYVSMKVYLRKYEIHFFYDMNDFLVDLLSKTF